MELTRDELAGVVDLFGGLTREELGEALPELAFRRGEGIEADAIDAAVADARESYALVALPQDAPDGAPAPDDLLVAGPTAFPTLPDGAEDLPHILDVPTRTVDRERAGRVAAERLRGEAARLLDADDPDPERARTLLDACYDLEIWAPVETDDVREALATAEAEADDVADGSTESGDDADDGDAAG